jgi:prepilin-type N-terminal cleavage/methylation domain-containing protein
MNIYKNSDIKSEFLFCIIFLYNGNYFEGGGLILNTSYNIHNTKSGFTLIELLLLIAVLGIVMAGILGVYTNVLTINKSNEYYSRGYRDLDSKMETLRGTLFTNLAVGTTTAAVPDLPGGQSTTVITNVVNGAPQTGILQVTVTISWNYKRNTQIKSSTFITQGGLKK